MSPEVSIIILAGGEGTRMKSRLPKVLHRAGGLPLIEHVIDTAVQVTTPDGVTVVVGSQAERVKQALATSIRPVRISVRATGHRSCSKDLQGCPA